jgi:hypothetical protein
MGIFDDNPFLQVKPGAPPTPQSVDSDAIAQGSAWTLLHRGGEYIIDYTSGELMGRRRTLNIKPDEAKELMAGGEAAADRIFARHGVG